MKNDEIVRWTIEELRGAVAAALGEGYGGPPNGRVRDVPDQRTIRYYTTLGLIDRASEMRGRTALYGTRHLFQLVAIKKLQAQGQSLAEVQQALVGQPTAAIARLAGLSLGRLKEKPAQGPRSTRSFWKEAPAPACKPKAEEAPRSGASFKKVSGTVMRNTTQAVPETVPDTFLVQGIQLAANVTLLVAGSRTLEESDLAALRLASSPLIDLLTKLEIISPREEGDPR
jgi:DNA-binding transcriptional MerR regulator